MRSLLLLLAALAGCATPAATRAPTPAAPAATGGDQAPLTEQDVTTATVNGLRILIKRTPGAEFASGHLYILGGVRNWTAQDAGLEGMAISVATHGGTTRLDKDAFARRLAALGAVVAGGSGDDYALFYCKALLPQWDETFAMMVDAFLRPALPASELELVRAQRLSGLRHEQESPEGRLGLLMHDKLYAGHPYANRPVGTLQSVAAVKAEQLAPHLARLRETSRLLWVVVGDVDPAHVLAQAKEALGGLPRGTYVETPLPALQFPAARVFSESRTLPTNYIQGVYLGPGWKDADLAAGMVASNLLRERLFEEVRTKRNLSYAPSAFLSAASGVPLGGLSVTAVSPGQTYQVMLDEVRRLQREPPSAVELAGSKSTFLTALLMGSETVDGQAGLLARATIYGGDWHLARTLPERIHSVTAADVQRFAQSRMHGLQTGVVGDPQKVDAAIFQSL
jgi:zinc protease